LVAAKEGELFYGGKGEKKEVEAVRATRWARRNYFDTLEEKTRNGRPLFFVIKEGRRQEERQPARRPDPDKTIPNEG